MKRQGLKELVLGVVYLAICLTASGSIGALDLQPDFPRALPAEGLVIVGWISLWHPVDLLLFCRWPSTIRYQTVLEQVRGMDIWFEAE